jgi:hypothetical protein
MDQLSEQQTFQPTTSLPDVSAFGETTPVETVEPMERMESVETMEASLCETTPQDAAKLQRFRLLLAQQGYVRPGTAEFHRVRRLLNGLGRKNWVRRLAERALRQEPIEPKEVEALIHCVIDPSAGRWRRRQVAAWTLAHIPLDDEQKVLASHALCLVLDQNLPYDTSRMFRLCVRWVSTVLALAGGLALLTTLGDNIDASAWLYNVLVAAFAMAILSTLFFMPAASLVADDRRVNRVRAEAAWSLGLLRQAESVDALAAVVGPLSGLRRPALTSLLAILPLLTPEHYGQLKTPTVPNLCQHVLTQADDDLVLAALTALERAGDGRAVAPVKLLCHESVREPIRGRALNVLPILQERQDRERASGMLLRGAEAPVATPDQLVRPVDAESFTPSEQLLRADLTPSPSPKDLRLKAQGGEGSH